MLQAAKMLIPYVKSAFYNKLKQNVKTQQIGKGMKGRGTEVDNKVLAIVSNKL